MKIKIFLLLAFSLFFGCSKSKESDISQDVKSDSISYYLKKSNLYSQTEIQKAKSLDKAFELIITSKNSSKKRDSLFEIVLKYYTKKDWDKFKSSSSQLLKKSIASKDSINIAKSYRFKANYLKKIEIYDSSFIYYLKAEKIYNKLDDKLNYANILYNKGIVQHIVNNYLGAELSLSKAYYIFKESGEKEKLYGTLNQLGLVYNELKEYDRAEEYHIKALETVREFNLQNEEHQEAVCYNNLGYLFIKQKKYKEAINNFELGLRDKTTVNDDPELYSSLIDNLAYCKLQVKDYNELPQLFFEALELRKNLDNYTIVVGSYIHLSEYYQSRNDLPNSLLYSNEALRVARESKIPVNIILALKQASKVDLKNALKYSQDYVRINDSLQLADRNSQDRFTRLQLETDQVIKENDELVLKNRNILNYFFGTVFIICILFFMRNQRSRARELALKQAQQQANEEIYRLIISHQDQLEEGRDLEKKRLSKELHDGVLGRIFGLRLNLDGLNSFNDDEAKNQRLEYLNELKIIEQDLRDISHELSRENLVLINNFVAILNTLIEQQEKINPAKVKVIIADEINWDKVTNMAKINLYRILQESFQNINKHAEAKNIFVHFRKDKKGNLLLNIEDDGKGFDTNNKKNKGIGTKNIVARTQQCFGIIDIKSEIGKGSKIIITFPLDNTTIKV